MGTGSSKGPKSPSWCEVFPTDKTKVTCKSTSAARQGVRPDMEDHHAVMALPSHPHILFCGVFDGHCGDDASEYVNRRVPEVLDKTITEAMAAVKAESKNCDDSLYAPSVDILKRCLHRTFIFVDEEFMDKMEVQQELQENNTHAVAKNVDGGSTAIVAVLNTITGDLVCANIGDAQCTVAIDHAHKDAKAALASRINALEPDDERCAAIELTLLHKPHLLEERLRIEAADYWVSVSLRVSGLLAVSRAFGDMSFKRAGAGTVIQRNMWGLAPPKLPELDMDSKKVTSCLADMKRGRKQRLEWQTNFLSNSARIPDQRSVRGVASKQHMVVTDLEAKEEQDLSQPSRADSVSKLERAHTTLGHYTGDTAGGEQEDRQSLLTGATSRVHPLDQAVNATPYLASMRITRANKFMILACDGLYEVMSSEDSIMWVNRRLNQFKRKLQQEARDGVTVRRNAASRTAVQHYGLDMKTIKAMSGELADYAIQTGSKDNVSVVIVFFGFPEASVGDSTDPAL